MQTPSQPAIEHELESVRSIALLRMSDTSELFSIVPAGRALRARFPQAEITLIAPAEAQAFVERMPFIDHLLVPADASFFNHYAGLFDLVVQMQDGERASNDLALVLQAPVTMGFSAEDDARLTVSLPWQRREHDVLRWMRLIEKTGAKLGNPRIDLPRLPHDDDEARRLLGNLSNGRQPLVGINLAPGRHRAHWQVRRVADLMTRMARRWDARFVLLGDASESGIAHEVKRAAKRVQALDLTGKLDLGMRIATIAQLDLLISGDSEAMDLASATTSRTVLLFGPTDPARRAPLNSELHHVLDVCMAIRTVEEGVAGIAKLAVEPVLQMCERAMLADGWRPIPAEGFVSRVRAYLSNLGGTPVANGRTAWGSLGRQAAPGRLVLSPAANATGIRYQ